MKARGNSLGAAIMALVAAPERTTKQELAYVLSPRTGASKASVARQLGVKQRTLTAWSKGTPPSKASQGKIKGLYEKFFAINNKGKAPASIRNAQLRITNKSTPDGIKIGGRSTNPLTVERSTRRRWDRITDARTPQDAYEWFVRDVLGPSPLPPVSPEYLDFEEGEYEIEAV